MNKIKVPPLSTSEISNITIIIRNTLKLADNDSFDMHRFLEFFHKIDESFTYKIAPDNLMPKYTEAQYLPTKNCMIISESVYEKLCINNGRAIFTIAHEFGHYFLHKDATALNRVSKVPANTIKTYEDSEWQANTFASLLLMPQTGVRNINDIRLIAKNYGTSFEAARVALNRATRK